MSKKKIKYNNTIWAFDIETTTTDDIVHHYLSNFASIDFTFKNKSVNEIVDNITPPIWCRTAEDVNDVLSNINEYSINEDVTTIIYIQNLGYEFDYLIKNIPFVKDNFSNDNSLFIKTRTPLFVRLDHIELRCSYRLLNMSLAKLGKNLGFEKLELDYSNKWYEFSVLPDIEYLYNERDVKLTLLAVLKECNNWDYINTVNDIPLTSTGFTRKNNEHINHYKDVRNWQGLCNYQKKFDKEYIEFLEKTFTGGYTHANAFYFNKPLANIDSYDISSSYPHSILHRDYPHYFHKYNGSYQLEYLKLLIRENNKDYKEILKKYKRPFMYSFMANVKLINVHAKILKNNNLILPISLSKCDGGEGFKLDNGRVFKASWLSINVTEIDYYIFTQFYEFEIVECENLVFTSYHRALPNYVTNSTRTYLHQKSTLKKVLSKYEDGFDILPDMFYNKNKGGYIFTDDVINNICTLERVEQGQQLNDLYRTSKNRLNAQYGINVQKLLTPNINYNVDNDEFSTDIVERVRAYRLSRDFTKGLYITAYSRLTLFCFALSIIENTDAILIYSDTDSWKIMNDLDNVHKTCEKYNKMVELSTENNLDYGIGSFEYEKSYKNFCTLGCKKYIVCEENKKTKTDEIISTIAGVSKVNTSKALTELYHTFDDDFESLCEVAFSPATILDYSVTYKVISKYTNNEYEKEVVDDNGKSGFIKGHNMVKLCASDYIIMDTLTSSVKEYVDYCEMLQGQAFDKIPTLIYRNSENKVTYKYITNWKEAIKEIRLYDTSLPEFENIVF